MDRVTEVGIDADSGGVWMRLSLPCTLLFLVAALVIAGPAHAQSAPAKAPVDGARGVDLPEFRIGPEDMLQVLVWKNDAMSRVVPVRPDGKISLPLLNDVQAAGLTPMELREVLTKKITEYVSNPEVSVIVTEVRSFKVSVMGEIPRPGRYELKAATTVLDLLALAGGFNQFSARSRIFILRPEGKGMNRIPFNYNKAVGTEGEQDNFYLRAGDVVVVP